MNLRHAIRGLSNRPSFTLTALAALALGIGLNTAIFSVVNSVLLRPLPFPHADELIRVTEHTKSLDNLSTSDPNFEDWSHEATTISAATEFRSTDYTLSGVGDAERLRTLEVSASFFATSGVFPSLGRAFRPEEDKLNASAATVVTDAVWRGRFGGDPAVIGRTIDLNGKPYTVVGVMPAGFSMPTIPCDILVPAGLTADNNRDNHRGEAFARLKPGETVARAQAEFTAISSRLASAYPRSNSNWYLDVTPLHDSIVADVRPALLIVLGAVGLVLMIACANVANLSLVRASERRREIAVRISLGASRVQIGKQLLIEALLLSLTGGLVGIGLAHAVLRSLIEMLPPAIAGMDVSIDNSVLLFTLGVSLVSGIIFGMIPALGSWVPDLTGSLKDGGRSSSAGESGSRLRSALAAAEIGFALVLAVGAGLLLKSFAMIERVNPGFQPSGVITMRIALPAARYRDEAKVTAFWDRLLELSRNWTGVEAAGLTSFLPLTDTDWETIYGVEGDPVPASSSSRNWVDGAIVSPDYFAAMGIPVKQGRAFDATDDTAHPRVVVIDEWLARKHWRGQNPIGRQLYVPVGKPRMIVGVVGHVKPYGLDTEEHVQIYLPYRQSAHDDMSLSIKTSGNTSAIVGEVRSTVRQLDSAVGVFNVSTMRQWVDNSTARRRFTALLMGLFAVAALLLAALGVFGVMAYSVAQRSHEMGIRLALGASTAGLKMMVVRQGLTLCAVGVGVGLITAVGLTRMMTSVLFEVQPFDPFIFFATAALLCAVAMAASYLPARRASRTDPMNTLRCE